MDQVALLKLENAPDRLTLHRLEELFAPCLNCEAVDLSRLMNERVKTLLETETPYIALVSGSRYEGIVERTAAERAILRQIVIPTEE